MAAQVADRLTLLHEAVKALDRVPLPSPAALHKILERLRKSKLDYAEVQAVCDLPPAWLGKVPVQDADKAAASAVLPDAGGLPAAGTPAASDGSTAGQVAAVPEAVPGESAGQAASHGPLIDESAVRIMLADGTATTKPAEEQQAITGPSEAVCATVPSADGAALLTACKAGVTKDGPVTGALVLQQHGADGGADPAEGAKPDLKKQVRCGMDLNPLTAPSSLPLSLLRMLEAFAILIPLSPDVSLSISRGCVSRGEMKRSTRFHRAFDWILS